MHDVSIQILTKSITTPIQSYAPALAQLDKEIFSDPWSRAVWENDLSAENNVTLLLQKQDVLAGFCNYIKTVNFLELKKIGIHPKWRKQGFGKLLLENLISQLSPGYVTEIFLEVAEDNKAAIELYRKFQFKEYSRRKKYYAAQIDAICMKYELRNI